MQMQQRALAFLLLLAGCGLKAAELDRTRPAAAARLAAFEAVGLLLKDLGPLTSISLDVQGPAPSFPPCLGHENAIVIGAEDFEDLTNPSSKSRLVPLNPIGGVASWARKGVTPLGTKPDPDDYLQRVERLLQLKYVLVVRTTRLIEPQISNPGEFVGGSCAAEALLFDLDQKKFLGGVGMEGSNPSKISIPGWVSNTPEWVMENLREMTFAGAKGYFKQRFPEASPPFHK